MNYFKHIAVWSILMNLLSYKFVCKVCICKNCQYDFELDLKRSQIIESFRLLVASPLSIREMSRQTLFRVSS